MPGPANSKRKSRKATGKHQQQATQSPKSILPRVLKAAAQPPSPVALSNVTNRMNTTHPAASIDILDLCVIPCGDFSSQLEVDNAPKPTAHEPSPFETLPPPPFIYDPGNGPRVRDARAFMSSFFAQGPSLDDPMCAEYAQEEVLQMLMTVLPKEMALILWYNKSRSASRICPACQRLYRLGDILPEHLSVSDNQDTPKEPPPEHLGREQTLSGICSSMCFILASFNYPAAIKSAWGHTAEEMDDAAWSMLAGSGEGYANTDESRGLAMLVRMTRLSDLGLAQLCFPGLDLEE